MGYLKCFYLIYTSGYETTISAMTEDDAIHDVGRGLPAYSTELYSGDEFEYYLLTWKDGISMTIVAPSIMAAVYKSGKGTPLTTEILEKKEEKEKLDLNDYDLHKKMIEMSNSIISWWEGGGKHFIHEPKFVKIAKELTVSNLNISYENFIKKLRELV